MGATKKTGGMAGITAGETHLCTVGKEGAGLTYCGYDIYDLAHNASFEEVAYLLLHGKLPNQAELDAFVSTIKSKRGLPDALKTVLEMVPADAHPMDVMRTGVSFLGNIEPEGDFANQGETANRLLACLPSILLYWHRYHADGVRIDTETDDDSIAGHFLHVLHDEAPERAASQEPRHDAYPLRRTRVQRVHVCGARNYCNALGHALRRCGCNRRTAGAVTWRRQRSGYGADFALRHTRGRGCRYP